MERTESRMKLGEGNRLGKRGQAGRGAQAAHTGRIRVDMISFLESRRARVQSRLLIVRGRVMRQRGVMEPHAGNAEMVEATEVERGEKRRSF